MLSDEALLLLKPPQDLRAPSFAGGEEAAGKEEEQEGGEAVHTWLTEKAASAHAREGGGNGMGDEAERNGERDQGEYGERDGEEHDERDEGEPGERDGDEGEYSSSISHPSTFPSPSGSLPMGCAGGATAHGGWGFNVETYESICIMLRDKAQELNQELLLRTARCVLCICTMCAKRNVVCLSLSLSVCVVGVSHVVCFVRTSARVSVAVRVSMWRVPVSVNIQACAHLWQLIRPVPVCVCVCVRARACVRVHIHKRALAGRCMTLGWIWEETNMRKRANMLNNNNNI